MNQKFCFIVTTHMYSSVYTVHSYLQLQTSGSKNGVLLYINMKYVCVCACMYDVCMYVCNYLLYLFILQISGLDFLNKLLANL